MVKKPVLLILLLITLFIIFTGCDKTGSRELTIYCALPETEISSYIDAFKKITGITVNFERLSAGEIYSKIMIDKNNQQASIWFGGNYDNFNAAAKAGLLEPYNSPELRNIPGIYQNADNFWSPIYVNALGFTVNKEWFAEKQLEYPISWNDLLKNDFKGKIAMSHPGTSGTAYTVLATIVQIMGEEKAWNYFKDLNKNIEQYAKSGPTPPKITASGEAAIGIAFSNECLKPLNEGYPVGLLFPNEGTGYEIGCIALIKNGKEKERKNAEKFIDWCLSKAGQDIYAANNSYRIPVNILAASPKGAPNISDLKIINYNFDWAADNKLQLVEEFTKVIASKDNLK